MRRHTTFVVALGLIIAACSGSEASETTTTTIQETTTTTTAETTTTLETTTTGPTLATSPVNGLPVEDPTLLERRVLAVKIDNHPNARPQSGINEADAIIEVLVEGVTRFISVWHQSDSEFLGPMRSGRPTDAYLLPGLNEPTFSISGAQGWVQNLIRSQGIHLTGEVKPATFRSSARRAPHNLYMNTNLMREYADSRDYPDVGPQAPIWEFGPLPAGGTEITSVRMNFSGNIVNWTWGEAESAWLRTVNGADSNYRDEDGTEGRIAFPVMVALYGEAYTATPPGGGKGLPSTRSIGTGKAFVFAEGRVIEGTWERETETDWFTITDEAGNVVPIPAGKIWISLVPGNNGVTLTP